MSISKQQLLAICPNCADSDSWAAALDVEFAKVGFSKRQIAHFLSQTGHESNDFKSLEENLNYSSERLLVVFPKYFTSATASKYHRKPSAIGSRVYANRMGNGDEASGDGYKFRGRGILQITGKNNYTACSTYLGIDLISNPDQLLIKKYAIGSALWFWHTNNIADIDDVTKVTKKVNGGTIGLDDRLSRFNKAIAIL